MLLVDQSVNVINMVNATTMMITKKRGNVPSKRFSKEISTPLKARSTRIRMNTSKDAIVRILNARRNTVNVLREGSLVRLNVSASIARIQLRCTNETRGLCPKTISIFSQISRKKREMRVLLMMTPIKNLQMKRSMAKSMKLMKSDSKVTLNRASLKPELLTHPNMLKKKILSQKKWKIWWRPAARKSKQVWMLMRKTPRSKLLIKRWTVYQVHAKLNITLAATVGNKAQHKLDKVRRKWIKRKSR